MTVLRHLDLSRISEAARRETRNREVHLPPVSVYRWWARRAESVFGAVLEAFSQDHPGPLLVADPFAGGGVIPLAAILRQHRVYAQDLNPWAVQGLCAMLSLPPAAAIREAGQRLGRLAARTVDLAYRTALSDGSEAMVSATLRVATACCAGCGARAALFPHALVTLLCRRERGQEEAFLACPEGHLFRGRADRAAPCPWCGRRTDPRADYTPGRRVTCPRCGGQETLQQRALSGSWRWEVALVERAGSRRREIDLPRPTEREQADGDRWHPRLHLGEIPDGQETRVLTRHGFARWEDLYPARQRAVMEKLLGLCTEAGHDEKERQVLRTAVLGVAEMAGHLSRWDRFYLKSYEAMAGHRFNFTTFCAEPNVWGAAKSGRGTVRRRLQLFERAATWLTERNRRSLALQGPLPAASGRRTRLPEGIDARIVEGSSERMLLPARSVDLVLTDPPYHDDVQYHELSLPLRAWARMSTASSASEAVVNPAAKNGPLWYRGLLREIFTEVVRVLRPGGHLVLSYANRDPRAWTDLLAALQGAGLRAVGYAVVHSENETDQAKRGVRACSLDLLMDLVKAEKGAVRTWCPHRKPQSAEHEFLQQVGEAFLQLGELADGWEQQLVRRLRGSRFLA